jgi:hypothetical protein
LYATYTWLADEPALRFFSPSLTVPVMSYNPIQSSHNHQVYQNDDPAFNHSTGFITPAKPAKGTSKWIKIGIPVAILVIAGAVVGGILGSRKSSSSSAATSSAAAASSASAKLAAGIFATATNSEYMIPIYPSTTNTALFTTPTFNSASAGWPSDTFTPSSPSVLSVRPGKYCQFCEPFAARHGAQIGRD